jgi:serine/threonine-protein kinase
MATGGSPIGAPRAKDGSKGAAGRYAFVTEVARGYLGALWLARDPEDSSPEGTVFSRHVTPLVAASARAAILEGARWAIGGADSPTFQVMEGRTAVDLIVPYVEGEPLRTLLRTAAVKHATPEPALLLAFFRDLVEQIEPVHERASSTKSPYGFGSINPDSILLDISGRVHLLDVGAAAAASSREPWRSDPQRVGYFAPEQTESRGVVDARTDVFAVGILMWEALANRRLFPGNDAKTARERVQRAPIMRLDSTRSSAAPGIATNIADVVARCLERDPAARFQSMFELAKALELLATVPAERVGAWVTGLADVVIAKRRQLLSRLAAGQSLPPLLESRPPPSVGERRALAPSTLPTRPAPTHVTTLTERPSVVPPSARMTVPNPSPALGVSSGSTLPGISRAPLPPSARASATPLPPAARASATPLPPAVRSSAPPPPSARASATTTPVAGTAPAVVEPAETPAPVAASPEATPVVAAAVVAPAPAETPAAPRAAAPTEDVPESDDIEDDEGEETAAEVEPELDDDEHPTPSKRPPPLPHDEHPAPLEAFLPAPERSHASAEPLATPIRRAELASLTAPAPVNPLPRRAAIIALVTVVGLGGWFLGRSKPKTQTVEIRSVQPRPERTVETPPVQIDEHLSAVSAAPPSSAAPVATIVAQSAPEVPAASATPPAEDSSATPSHASGASSPTNAEKPSAPKTPHAVSTPNETSHRPSAPNEGSGFKPGGI